MFLLLNYASLAEKQQRPILWSSIWHNQWSKQRSTAIEASTLTITPLIRYWHKLINLLKANALPHAYICSECHKKSRKCISFAVTWVHPRFVCGVGVANRFSLSSYVFVVCGFFCCCLSSTCLISYFGIQWRPQKMIKTNLSHIHLSDGIHFSSRTRHIKKRSFSKLKKVLGLRKPFTWDNKSYITDVCSRFDSYIMC